MCLNKIEKKLTGKNPKRFPNKIFIYRLFNESEEKNDRPNIWSYFLDDEENIFLWKPPYKNHLIQEHPIPI